MHAFRVRVGLLVYNGIQVEAVATKHVRQLRLAELILHRFGRSPYAQHQSDTGDGVVLERSDQSGIGQPQHQCVRPTPMCSNLSAESIVARAVDERAGKRNETIEHHAHTTHKFGYRFS